VRKTQITKPTRQEKEGTVKIAMRKEGDGWATPEESWLDKEATEDGETFFVNVKSMFL
jgi:hypothetical protein